MVTIGDRVYINTPWANDTGFPNCYGTVVDTRFGGNVAIIKPEKGSALRTLHMTYFLKV